jgi:hypothetical protein
MVSLLTKLGASLILDDNGREHFMIASTGTKKRKQNKTSFEQERMEIVHSHQQVKEVSLHLQIALGKSQASNVISEMSSLECSLNVRIRAWKSKWSRIEPHSSYFKT